MVQTAGCRETLHQQIMHIVVKALHIQRARIPIRFAQEFLQIMWLLHLGVCHWASFVYAYFIELFLTLMHIGLHHTLLMFSGTFHCNTLFTNIFKLAKLNEQKSFSPDVCPRSVLWRNSRIFQLGTHPEKKRNYLNVKSSYPFLQKFHWSMTLQKDHNIF